VAPSSPLDILWSALDEEAATLGTAFDDLKNLAGNISAMSVEAALKQLVTILGEAVLKSAKTVVDAILKILYSVAKSALDWLLTDIEIPIVSDVLADWGITKLDVLDLLCYTAALPVSLMFDFESYPAGLNNAAASAGGEFVARVGGDDNSLSDKKKAQRFAGLHVGAGICGFVATYLIGAAELIASPESEEAGLTKAMAAAAWFFNFGSEALQLAAITSVPDGQIKDVRFRDLLTSVLGIQIGALLVFNPLWFLLGSEKISIPKMWGGGSVANPQRVEVILWVGTILDLGLMIPEFVATGKHLDELAHQNKTDERDLGIVDEVSNIMSFISRTMRPLAFVVRDPETKVAIVAIDSAAHLIYSIMQIAEGARGWVVYESRQKHAVLAPAV